MKKPRRELDALYKDMELALHRKYRALLIRECGTDDIAVLSSLKAQVAALSAKLTEVEMMIMPYRGECSPEGHKALCSLVPRLIIEKVALVRQIERMSKQHRVTHSRLRPDVKRKKP